MKLDRAAARRFVVRAAAMAFLALYPARARGWRSACRLRDRIRSLRRRPSNPTAQASRPAEGIGSPAFAAHPALWLAPLLALAAAAGAIAFALTAAAIWRRSPMQRARYARGTILSAGSRPVSIPDAVQPRSDSSLTIWDASQQQAHARTDAAGDVIFLPIVIAYTSWVYRVLRGRVSLEHIRSSHGHY